MRKLKTELLDGAAAFLLSTFAAMLALPIAETLERLFRLARYGQLEMSRVLAISNPYSHFGVAEMGGVWLFFMLASLIPYAAGLAGMRYFRFGHWFAYLVFGEVTAIFTAVIPLFALSFRRWATFEEVLHGLPSFLMEVLFASPILLMCGLAAGGVCAVYFHLRTHHGSGNAEPEPSSLPPPEGQAARG